MRHEATIRDREAWGAWRKAHQPMATNQTCISAIRMRWVSPATPTPAPAATGSKVAKLTTARPRALVGATQSAEDYLATRGDDPVIAAMGDYLAALPPDQFPNLTAAASEMAAGNPDERFEFALALLLRGMATYVES